MWVHTAKVQTTLFRPLRECYGRERLCLATLRTSVQRDREGSNLDFMMPFQLSS